MDNREARTILSVHRPGDAEIDDPRFQEAVRKAETDPSLAQWWAEEQEIDRIIGMKLQSVHVPAKPQGELISERKENSWQRPGWSRTLLVAAAIIIALAVLFGSWRGPFQPASSLADYRDEMVGFVKVDPALELETSQLESARKWLAKTSAFSELVIPQKLAQMEPVGCRTLRYRGHDVALICFKRSNGQLLHLFVVKKDAVPGLPGRATPEWGSEGEWMTAAWQENGGAYLVMIQGDREKLEEYIETS